MVFTFIMSYTEFLSTQSGCHFCWLDKRELIYESEYFIVVPARAPYTKDNLLVISKRHIHNFAELNELEDKDLSKTLKLISNLIYTLWYNDLSLFVRDGKPNDDRSWSWKSVWHLHYHILPGANVSCLAPLQDDTRVFYTLEELFSITEKLKKEFEKIMNL